MPNLFTYWVDIWRVWPGSVYTLSNHSYKRHSPTTRSIILDKSIAASAVGEHRVDTHVCPAVLGSKWVPNVVLHAPYQLDMAHTINP